MALTVLLVEPDEALREEVRRALREDGHRVWAFSSAQGALGALGKDGDGPDLALLALDVDPQMDSLSALLDSRAGRCQKAWIAPDGAPEIDRIASERRPRGLLSRTALVAEARTVADRVWKTREREKTLVSAPTMLGESETLMAVKDLLDRIAASGAATVLITGESGTGKDVAARRLHAFGPRSGGPFVEVDCASIPANLLESELFGHEPGAFTDARSVKVGLLELAQGGTAFLDEIGELDLALQAKLLRVLDTRRMRRLGGRNEIPLDVHLIAATNRNLGQEVDRGAFRGDLYYRLDVVRVELPAVRDRGEDAWLLANAFLEEVGRRLGRGPLSLAGSLMESVLRYPWPGNVREIRNHMERLALRARPGQGEVTHLELQRRSDLAPTPVRVDFRAGPLSWSEIERGVLTEALRAANGNVSEAARLLGLGRGALRYRLKRHGLDVSGAPERTEANRKAA